MNSDTQRELAHELGLQVAIDGPAGAGKSTVGQGLARALGCPYVDTGLMYRAVALAGLKHHIHLDDGTSLAAHAEQLPFALDDAGGMEIDHEAPSPELRSPEVDGAVSQVSAHPEVRSILVRKQRELADRRCVVMVGRDIGTEVLPDAPVKLWVTASARERAMRRLAERPLQFADIDSERMLELIQARDAFDSSRPASPLRCPPDAVVIETDKLTVEEALERALSVTGKALERLRPCREDRTVSVELERTPDA